MTPPASVSYKVAIRKNETGEIRLYVQSECGPWGDLSKYFWTDGNFGCDCNRADCFRDAGGEEPNEQEECGETRYTALYAELPSGERIKLDEVSE